MNLRDRGRRHGFAEICKNLINRYFKFTLNLALGFCFWKGWQFVLQNPQLKRQIVADHIRAG